MSKRTGLGRGLGAFFGNDYENAEAGKSSAKPSDEAGKKTSVRETEQEIEKKSLEELDMVLPGSKKQKKIGVCRKDSCENSGKRKPRGSCKGIRKDDGRRKNPHSRGDGGKIEDTDGKSGAGRKDRRGGKREISKYFGD